jgi:hypothetical protein
MDGSLVMHVVRHDHFRCVAFGKVKGGHGDHAVHRDRRTAFPGVIDHRIGDVQFIPDELLTSRGDRNRAESEQEEEELFHLT